MMCQCVSAKWLAPYKGELETWYQHNRSLWVDAMLVFLTAWIIVFPKTSLPFRLLKSLPPRPTFLIGARDLKSSQASARAGEDAPGIVEIGPAARKVDKGKVLR